MAIHIRPRKSLVGAENRRRIRMRFAALASALSLIAVVGAILFLIIINIPRDHSTSFQYAQVVEEPEVYDDLPQTVEVSSSSSVASAAANSYTPQIIVATGISTTQMGIPDFAMEGDFGSSEIGLGEGFAPGSLGDGKGLGTGGTGRGNGGSGSGGRKHGKGSNDDIQVVILLDASGSMDQLFTTAAESLEQLLNMLNSCRLNGRPAKVNLGIVAYGAAKGAGAPWTVSKFSKDVKGMRKRLAEVACDGSEEYCGQAIQYALKEFPWNMRERGQLLKVIFIAGNEGFDQGPVDYHKALAQAKEMGVIVNTIVCGGQDETWASAAREGGGESFSIDFQAPGGTTPAERLETLKTLYNCEIIPTGSPADIERREQEIRKRPGLPNARTLDKWLSQNQQMLIGGFEWDAVELCRRMDSEFTLEMVGGLANLPQRFRAMGGDGALNYIRSKAAERQGAIEDFKDSYSGGSDFCNAAMEALRKQALLKGIQIEM